MTEISPLLDARDLRRLADDGTVLLADASLSVPAGSSTAILGPPGAGKTLLLRLLSLLDPAESGEVRFRGQPVEDHQVPSFRRQVILVPQRPVLIDGTVRSNLQLPFRFAPAVDHSFDEQRIVSWLTSLNREAVFLDRASSALSGGESQIVALLRAIQLDPAVLLLDEPTSSLDSDTTTAVEQLIVSWLAADAERALVAVTHRPDQAERLTERTIQMENGSIISEKEHAGHSA